jgi:hypothetical protein
LLVDSGSEKEKLLFDNKEAFEKLEASEKKL